MEELNAFRTYLTEDDNGGKNIRNFINQNKEKLVGLLANRYNWDASEVNKYNHIEVYIGANSEGQLDADVAGFDDEDDGGFDFSFDASKVQSPEGEGTENFTLSIGGVLVYGIWYDIS